MTSDPGLTRDEANSLLGGSKPVKPSGRGRKVLIVLGGLLLIIIGVIAFLPTIAGGFVRGMKVLNSGTVQGTIQSASLGWFSNQSARIALTDHQNKPSGGLDINVDRGLFGLATNWYNLGTIRVTGDVELREGPAIAAPAPSSPSSTSVSVTTNAIPIPKSLQARLDVSLTRLSVLDKAMKPVAELKDVKLNGDLKVGSPLTLDLSAKSEGSPLAAKIKVENWTDADGVLRLDTASLTKNSPKVNAEISADNLSVALLDAIIATATGNNQNLQSILGDSVTVRSTVVGDFNGGNAGLDVQSKGAGVAAKVAIQNGLVSLAEPVVARLEPSATQALLNKYVSKQQMGGLTITSAPSANIRLEKLNAKLPGAGGKLDLRGASVQASAEFAKTQGQIALGENQPVSSVEIPSFKASLASDDLAGTTRVNATASSTITTGDQTASAGDLNADIAVAGLLDAAGAPVSGLPKTIDGKVALRGASTGILQPFVAGALSSSGLVLDLPRDIGPTADIDLVAKSESGAIDIDLNARAQAATAVAALRITDDAIVSRENGISARLAHAGQIAARTLKKDSPLSFTKTMGQVAFEATGLNVPLEKATRKPKLDQMAAAIHAELSGWGLLASLPPGEGQSPGKPAALDLQTLSLNAALKPGAGATAKLVGDATANGSPITLTGNISLPNIAAAFNGSTPPAPNLLAKKFGAFYALARIDITGLPSSLAEIMPHASNAPSTLPALVREALGDSFNVAIETAPGKTADQMTLKADLTSPRTKVDIAGDVIGSKLQIAANGAGTITPGLLDALMSGNAADKPRLRTPASYTLTTEPVDVPLSTDGSPDLAKAGMLKARFALAGQTIIQSGEQAYGAQDFTVNAVFPLSALTGGAGGESTVQATAGLLSADGSSMGALVAEVAAPLGPKISLAGPADIQVKLSNLQTAGLDKAINQPGMVSGALGPTADLTAFSRISPATKNSSIADAIATADMAADITLVAQRLEIKKPLHARILADRISLEASEPLSWTIDPSWFDRFVLGKGQPGSSSDLSLAVPSRAELVITKAIISRADSTKGIEGPAFPGIFSLDATARIPSMELVDTRSVRTQMHDAVLKLQSLQATSGQGAPIGFALSFAKLAVTPDASKAGPGGGEISGTVSNIATASGKIDSANPIITAKGDIRSLPSALIDAFSLKNGLPGEILGPSININLDAQNFSKAGGSIAFNAASTETGTVVDNGKSLSKPRAEMSIKGNAHQGVLTTPLNITIRRVDLGLQKRLSDVLPMIADVEKRYEDKQTVISSQQLAIPLDGDTRKLNGLVSIDPGDARFKLSGQFGALLRSLKANDQGKMLQRLKPLNLTIANGIITYPRWNFPVGEFAFDIEGTVDLPGSRVDLITWVPFGQLADDVGKVFSKIPGVGAAGNTLNQSTMMPLRTTGAFGSTRTAPDVQLFAKNFIKNIGPGAVENLLKDVFKKPK